MLTSITRISTSIAVYWIQVFWQAKRSWGSYRSKHSLWFFLPCLQPEPKKNAKTLPIKLIAFLTNITESNWSIVLLSRLEISGSSGSWIVHSLIPTNQPTKQTSCKRRPQTSCNVQARWQYLDLQKPTSKSTAALLLLTMLLDFKSGKIEVQYLPYHAGFTTSVVLNCNPAIDFSALACGSAGFCCKGISDWDWPWSLNFYGFVACCEFHLCHELNWIVFYWIAGTNFWQDSNVDQL